jgi:hypothetical protein
MRLASDLAHLSLQVYRQLDAGCWVSSYKQTVFIEPVGKVLSCAVHQIHLQDIRILSTKSKYIIKEAFRISSISSTGRGIRPCLQVMETSHFLTEEMIKPGFTYHIAIFCPFPV